MQQGHFDLDGQLKVSAPEVGQRRVVWVPTEQVLLLSVSIPGRQWRQALPYAVEPWLATAVEANHIVPLKRQRDGQVHCVAVAQSRLAHWQAALAQAGWQDALLVPDCFQVPEGEQGWRWHRAGERFLVRTGPWRGFAGSEALCRAVLAQAGMHWTEAELQLPPWPVLQALNLNAGLSHRQGMGAIKRAWWVVGAAALLLLGLYLGQLAWETHRLNAQAFAYRAQTEALFRKLFPEVSRVVNIRSQTKAYLAQRAQFDTAPPRWAQVLAKVAQVEGTLIHLDDDGRRMVLTVRLPQAVDIQQLARSLGARIQAHKLDGVRQEVTYVVSD